MNKAANTIVPLTVLLTLMIKPIVMVPMSSGSVCIVTSHTQQYSCEGDGTCYETF